VEHIHRSAATGILQEKKIGKTFAYCLIFLVSLAGNTIIGIIVYKTKTMRKPINVLIVNMAISDLLFPIFLIPRDIQLLYVNSWLIGGLLGKVLCKLVNFLVHVSFAVSIQSLVLIAVDRFEAVIYPLRSPLISSKLCPFFILGSLHWLSFPQISLSPNLLNIQDCCPVCWIGKKPLESPHPMRITYLFQTWRRGGLRLIKYKRKIKNKK